MPCPPLSRYPEPLKDQSHAELIDCPKCKEKMWITDKKNGALMFASFLNQDILLGCYDCIEKHAEENASAMSMSKSSRVDL